MHHNQSTIVVTDKQTDRQIDRQTDRQTDDLSTAPLLNCPTRLYSHNSTSMLVGTTVSPELAASLAHGMMTLAVLHSTLTITINQSTSFND